MENEGVSSELVSVINQRIDLLRALTDPHSKRDLVEQFDLSRSTIDRAVRQLESLGLVTRRGDYRLTAAGTLVVEVFDDFVDDLGAVVRIEELLTVIPPDAPIALPLVRDAEVHRSSDPSPTEPVSVAAEQLEPATRIQLLIPRFTRPDVKAALERRVVEDEVPASFVLERALVDHLRRDDSDWLAEIAAAPNCELRVTESIPYALGVIRQTAGLHVGVVVYDADGNVHGFVENDTLQAYAWGEAVFRQFHEEAVRPDAVETTED